MPDVYRLKSTTIAIQINDGLTVPLTLPRGAEVTVISKLEYGVFVDCLWEDNKIQMLARDVTDRGEFVRSAEI